MLYSSNNKSTMKLLALVFMMSCVLCKNILLTNDDGFTATNIRATYRALKSAGHNVVMVAPVSQRSGWSGKFDVPYTKDLLTDGEFAYKVKGDPAWGHEPTDVGIWYFNGTPASCVGFGLDYVLPNYFQGKTSNSSNVTINKFDLVVSGPNEGLNLSPGLFTISGTIGAAVSAAYRGVPSIAFSGSNGNNSFFKDSLDEDKLNPSNIYADLIVDFVDQLFEAQEEDERLLPLGTGININMPPVGYQNESCTAPEWVYTRITGPGSTASTVKFNPTTGLVSSGSNTTKALLVDYNGLDFLPSEASTLASGCKSSVSLFSIDYDAPKRLQRKIHKALKPLFKSDDNDDDNE